MNEITTRDRFRGCLLGLAAGDALGTTLEFMSRDEVEPIDDTSMALCLATSLIERCGFDAVDQMQRYVRWWQDGYLSSNGYCFDIGITTANALSRFVENSEDPYAGSSDPFEAGNGSLMRLAPVPMYFAGEPAEAIGRSADSSRTTHGAREAIDACRYFGGLLVGALCGVDKGTLLSAGYCPVVDLWNERPLADKIAAISDGSFKSKSRSEVRGGGYVVETLEAMLWAFHNTEDFEEGALLVVNLGDDADTTGAIYGQIAGPTMASQKSRPNGGDGLP